MPIESKVLSATTDNENKGKNKKLFTAKNLQIKKQKNCIKNQPQ